MQTNVAIDHELVAKAMVVFGARTESEAVQSALETAIQLRGQEAILDLRGIGWDGDREEMRIDKPRPMID